MTPHEKATARPPWQAMMTKGEKRQFAQLYDAYGQRFAVLSPNILELEWFEANVSKIVTSVNSHAALVDALQELYDLINAPILQDMGTREGRLAWYEKASVARDRAREALRLAQATPKTEGGPDA